MARQRISEYVFTPGVSGSGTIKVPGRVNLEDFLAVYNTTDQISIYNFGDTAQGGSVAWTAGVTADFPTAYAGVTTLSLDANTSAMSPNDKLAIYAESQSLTVQPWAFGMDAIGRERVSNPEALIDADFEYGLQNTKWQNVSTINNIPAFFEDVGADIPLNTNGYVSMIAGDDQITSNVDTSVRLQNQGSAQWVAADFGLVISQTQGNVTPFTSNYLTEDINSSAERTFSVASTAGFTAGDNIIIIGNPGTGGTTVAVANITSVATTTVNCANVVAAGINDGSYIIVETDTANVFEVMAVTNVSGNALTVVRQSNRSNGTSANISIGNDVFAVNSLEVAQVYEVTDSTTLQLTRGWYNIPAANSFKLGSVIQKLSGNVELVNMSAINTAVNGVQTVVRGQFGTTALSAAGVGSPVIRMTGVFDATGNPDIPQIAVNADAHGLTTGDYVSSQNQANTNANGVSYVYFANDNNFAYYPSRTTGLPVGYPLNRIDSIIREAFQYTGADLDVVSIVSNGSTPSTITITTQYAHGLVPGTPVIVALTSGANQAYATGSFFVTGVPSTTTFTYTAKPGAAVSGSLAGSVNVRSNAVFLPRPFDGGVILGPGTPTRGASAVRQTKKYFRYQSGKGLLFTSGTMLKPTFDIAGIVAAGTTVGSNITVTTDIEHGLNAGAVVDLSGITTAGYNDTDYTVTSIGSDTAFVVEAQNNLGSVAPELGQQPRVSVTGWHGASIRAGMMDDQNGLFWEHNGQTLNVVQRSSTLQLAGFVSVGMNSNLVTGDGTCRFQDQLNNGDQVVIQGMTHTVTSVLDNNRMTIVPTFRGVMNQTRVKMTLRDEIRVVQDNFNVDRLDGTGYSGYTINPSKMQMLGVEYSWYGAGYVQWMVRGQDGKFVMAHRLPNNNRNNEAYMRSGNLPGRYEAINDTPVSSLDGAIDASQTIISLRDASQYPAASVTYPVFVMIDSEVIKYSGKSGNDLTGCTRAATFTQWSEGASRSFTSSSATSHADNTGVILISNTCSPLVNHWGSSVIMDGSFDDDEGYQFTFSRTSYGMPAVVGEKQTVFAMRLSPSVSNGIIGDLGERELINRAQLTLANMTVNITSGRFLVEGILNPSNIDSANTVWAGLNNAGGGFQPSFSQFTTSPRYTGETTGGVTGSLFGTEGGFSKSGTKVLFSGTRNRTFAGLSLTNVSSSGANANVTVTLTPTSTLYNDNTVAISVQNPGTGYAIGDTTKILGNALGGATPLNDLNLRITAITTELTGGERLFAIPISATNSGVLDLSSVKQIGTSAVPGTGTYPNGPEVLAIQVTALSTSTTPVADVQLQFQESQA
jgi:hypothetical protein